MASAINQLVSGGENVAYNNISLAISERRMASMASKSGAIMANNNINGAGSA